MDDWPSLAWVWHRSRKPKSRPTLIHGGGVWVGKYGFCEAVWDGPFDAFDFDRTDLVFGSGGRIRVDADGSTRWIFVGSGSTVDRLHHFRPDSGDLWVSNSIVALMAMIEARPKLTGWNPFAFFETIAEGLDRYERRVPIDQGEIKITYHDNLVVQNDAIESVAKPKPSRTLDCFADYDDFARQTMSAIGRNAAGRSSPIVPLASLSSGYDSTTAATIGREAGLTDAWTLATGRGDASESTATIASALGLNLYTSDRTESLSDAAGLALFLSGDAKGEDAYFSGADQLGLLSGRFLISGYSGSRVWDTDERPYPHLRRGDTSGLSHVEARLHLGYQHVPVPYFAGFQETDIRRIGRDREMDRWRVGGDYDRPLCRRIAESAGVPRDAFGTRKKAASVLWFDRQNALPESFEQSYRAFLKQYGITIGQPHLRGIRTLMRTIARTPMIRLPVLRRIADEGRIHRFAYHNPAFDHLYGFVVDRVVRRYARPAALTNPSTQIETPQVRH